MNNLRAFKIKHIGATDTKGSRISIKDLRFNKSIIIQKDYKYNNTYSQAYDFLKDKGIICLYLSEVDNAYIITTDNFKTQIK